MDDLVNQKIEQCKSNIADITKQIAEQEKAVEKLLHKVSVVENENKTLENLIRHKQTELDKTLAEKETVFIRAQELERKGEPEQALNVDEAAKVTSAFMNFYSNPVEEQKETFIAEDIDITGELEKLGLSDVVKKY